MNPMSFSKYVRLLSIALASSFALLLSAQDNWPQFRGSGSLGVGASKDLPDTWDTTKNVVWKTDIPGLGWASPVVWGEDIIIVTVVSDGEVEAPKKGLYFGGERPIPTDTHHWVVYSIDFDSGEVNWTTKLHQGVPKSSIHVKNTYASETPVTDGKHIYVYFGYMGLWCLDFDGNVVWKKTWEPFKMRNGWGTSASPVLFGDRVYVVNDNEEQSFMTAFDKATGEDIWRIERDEPSNFSTPYIWENDLRTELITTGVNKTRSYDLDGGLLWECQGMSSIAIPAPFSQYGLLYVSAGYVGDKQRPNKPVYAIRPGATGDLTLPEGERSSDFIAWMEPNSAPYNPSPLLYEKRLYTLWDFGFLSCRDAITGRELYGKQRISPRGRVGFTSSPWAYNGKVFCLSEDGDTYVFQAGDEYKLLHTNPLDELCMSTPAIIRDNLLIRTASKLYRFQKQ